MVERELLVANQLGLHARAAAKLVQLLSRYSADAVLLRGGRQVNAKSIMGVMLLAAGQGTTVLLRLDGPDEQEALAEAADLFARLFDEEA